MACGPEPNTTTEISPPEHSSPFRTAASEIAGVRYVVSAAPSRMDEIARLSLSKSR